MSTTRTSGSIASEPRRCSRRGCHGTTSDGFGKRSVGLSDNKVTSARVEHGAILVFRAIVLDVVTVDMATGRLGLRIIKVFLVKRSNAVSTLLGVLLRVIRRRHGT